MAAIATPPPSQQARALDSARAPYPAALTASAPLLPPSPPRRQGARLGRAAAAAGLGLAVRWLVPIPEGIEPQAWSLFGFFIATVAGLVLEPVPAGAWALMCAGCALASHALTFQEAFQASDSQVLWLIVLSFFLAKGFEKTGLGERVAEMLVRSFGGSTLSLGLSLALGEALLAPGMPSTTARGAGIFVPVIKSVSAAAGSYPEDDASRHKIGAYLIQSQLQASAHSSTMFLTAGAQNLLCLQLAESLGLDLGNHFLVWSQGALVPALLGTVLTPYLVYWLQPPTIKDTPEAPKAAAARLEQLGRLTQDETVMLAAVGVALTLWVFGDRLGVPPVVAAMLAVGILVGAGVLDWRADCLRGTPQAWDTLFWFGVLISMSLCLQERGVIAAFTGWASGQLGALHLPWPALFGALHLQARGRGRGGFFLLHYLFASQTAHIGALYTAFLSLMIAGGVPPKLAALSLAYCVCLFGSTTHYASGQAAVYVGSGFLSLKEVFVGGAVCGAAALALWGTAGMAWWKVLGWW
ncbi:MAG: Sodium/sulfate symporter [Monoraphidium minutum]|nr:MAG: Sodium/sulfate symporter [Monoraphidium minutum]